MKDMFEEQEKSFGMPQFHPPLEEAQQNRALGASPLAEWGDDARVPGVHRETRTT